jgi:hypothetical protein
MHMNGKTITVHDTHIFNSNNRLLALLRPAVVDLLVRVSI